MGNKSDEIIPPVENLPKDDRLTVDLLRKVRRMLDEGGDPKSEMDDD